MIQLRQICLVAQNLTETIDDLTNILGINTCFIDPGVEYFGLNNTLMPIGRNFLEVVAPIKDDTAAGRYLQRRGGDGGYMVICQAGSLKDQQMYRQRALDQGIRIAHESERANWNICQLHPQDMMSAFLEIDWDSEDDLSGNWEPAGGSGWIDDIKQDVTVDYLGVELQGENADTMQRKWADVLGVASKNNAIKLNNSTIRFVKAKDGRGDGLGGIDLQVKDVSGIKSRAEKRGCLDPKGIVTICGTRFYLHTA
jgi:hypothetical protein